MVTLNASSTKGLRDYAGSLTSATGGKRTSHALRESLIEALAKSRPVGQC